jgi:hypothetical protein
MEIGAVVQGLFHKIFYYSYSKWRTIAIPLVDHSAAWYCGGDYYLQLG